mgnify:FL=1
MTISTIAGCVMMVASWYGGSDGLCGSKTANGELYDCSAYTAAHKKLPFNSHVQVHHNGKSVRVRINDRGPFVKGRSLDLSQAAAKAIGLKGVGTVQVCPSN